MLWKVLLEDRPMHLICPNCDDVFDTKNITRFSLFNCKKCGYHVRGIHCEPSRKWLAFDWVNPFSTASFDNWDHTACPFCGVMLRIYYSQDHTGFDGPSVCKACTRNLPTWESDHADGGPYHVQESWNRAS